MTGRKAWLHRYEDDTHAIVTLTGSTEAMGSITAEEGVFLALPELAAHTKAAEDRAAAAMKEAISERGCKLGFNQSGSEHNLAVHAFYTSLMEIKTPDTTAHYPSPRDEGLEQAAILCEKHATKNHSAAGHSRAREIRNLKRGKG